MVSRKQYINVKRVLQAKASKGPRTAISSTLMQSRTTNILEKAIAPLLHSVAGRAQWKSGILAVMHEANLFDLIRVNGYSRLEQGASDNQ